MYAFLRRWSIFFIRFSKRPCLPRVTTSVWETRRFTPNTANHATTTSSFSYPSSAALGWGLPRSPVTFLGFSHLLSPLLLSFLTCLHSASPTPLIPEAIIWFLIGLHFFVGQLTCFLNLIIFSLPTFISQPQLKTMSAWMSSSQISKSFLYQTSESVVAGQESDPWALGHPHWDFSWTVMGSKGWSLGRLGEKKSKQVSNLGPGSGPCLELVGYGESEGQI